MKQADCVALGAAEFDPDRGKLTLPFRVGRLDHSVHALYHDPPDLPKWAWDRCVDMLALSCLVDLSTSAMAAAAFAPSLQLPVSARRMFDSAARALRLEVIAEHTETLTLLPIRLRCGRRQATGARLPSPHDNRVMLLMGGGKDSLYLLRLLSRAGYDVQCFYLTEARRTWQQLRRVYAALQEQGFKQYRVFLDVNRRGRIDRRYGSVYASQFQIGQIAAASLPYAIAAGCRYIVLGLERSSDAPMYDYGGHAVNHQHQKSSPFLRLMNRACRDILPGCARFVSPLHALHDLGIYARFLESAPDLVDLQSSCGGANSYRRHCGYCEKCAFLAALFVGLGGALGSYRMLFPLDPLEDAALFETHWLNRGRRPLSCVGFVDELEVALDLAAARGWRSPAIDLRLRARRHAHRPSVLRRYTRVYANRLVPAGMKLRLAPYLAYDSTRIETLLTGRVV